MSTTPAARRRQQQWARWVRRVPGYLLLHRELLPRVRRSPLLNDLAARVFTPDRGPGEVDVPLHGGRYLEGPDLSLLPVVAVVATGLSPRDAAALLDDVAAAQRQTAAFRPVLVLDQPLFTHARHHGFVLEVVLPQEAWTGPGSWTDHVATRVASVLDHYQPWHLVTAHGPALDPLTVALLTHLADLLPPGLRVGPVTDDP